MTPEFKKACEKAKRLTANNFTAEAMAVLAKGLGSPEGNALAKRFEANVIAHMDAGELTPAIQQWRDGIWKDLQREITKQFGQHGLDHANKSL